MNKIAQNVSARRGFTLIEILIAVSVFAIVLASVNSVFYGALRLRNKTSAKMDEALTVEQVVSIIKHDLRGLAAPGGTLSGELMTDQNLTGMSQQTGTEFYTTTGLMDDDNSWSEMQRISYSLAQPTNQTDVGMDLIRTVSRNLLPVMDDDFEEQWLMSGLEQLTFEYYDGQDWVEYWDSTISETPTPTAIRVVLEFAKPQDETKPTRDPVELVIPIAVQQRIDTNTVTSAEN